MVELLQPRADIQQVKHRHILFWQIALQRHQMSLVVGIQPPTELAPVIQLVQLLQHLQT
jgi:hypothetical protein